MVRQDFFRTTRFSVDYQRRWVANYAPLVSDSSFAHAIFGWMRPPRPQSVERLRSRADDAREPLDPVGDEFGVLDHIRGVADHAGHDLLAIGQCHVLPHPPFVVVTDVRGIPNTRSSCRA